MLYERKKKVQNTLTIRVVIVIVATTEDMSQDVDDTSSPLVCVAHLETGFQGIVGRFDLVPVGSGARVHEAENGLGKGVVDGRPLLQRAEGEAGHELIPQEEVQTLGQDIKVDQVVVDV